MSGPVTLERILSRIKPLKVMGDLHVEISGIAHDTRDVKDGYLFAALPGMKADGHDFIPTALSAGARALLVTLPPERRTNATVVVVDDTRRAFALAAGDFYNRPDLSLKLIGITGTNGKTSTAVILQSILETAGIRCARMGTIGYSLSASSEEIEAVHTTPEADVVFSWLHRAVAHGAGACAMEVSSHALALNRIYGCSFDVAVFTNLTQDHLDFHKDMNSYFNAKKLLFDSLLNDSYKKGRAVVCADDPWGRRLIEELPSDRIISFGREEGADIHIKHENLTPRGMDLLLSTPQGEIKIFTDRLAAPFHSLNIAAAAAVALSLEISPSIIAKGVAAAPPVRGRFEKIEKDLNIDVFVDYAHTPDALKNAVTAAKKICKGRLITVFGCGGDRDRSKRPLMAEAAVQNSDVCIITSDNPRTEDPMSIIEDALSGVPKHIDRVGIDDIKSGALGVAIEPDRDTAIGAAVMCARKGDVVLIAGKGHETYQEINGKRFPFDDRERAAAWLSKRAAEEGKI